MGGDYAPMEGQHGCGIVWDTMVRPGCEVELLELKGLATLDLEGGREGGREGTYSNPLQL